MAKKPFNLEDLIPQEAEFTLSSTGKTYVIRAMNIEDWTWLKLKYGQEGMTDILEGKSWDGVCALVFRLLSNQDKEDFIAQDCVFFDEDTGEKTSGRIGGGKLLSHKITGIPEFLLIYKSLFKSIGAGEPKKEDVALESDEAKKKTETHKA